MPCQSTCTMWCTRECQSCCKRACTGAMQRYNHVDKFAGTGTAQHHPCVLAACQSSCILGSLGYSRMHVDNASQEKRLLLREHGKHWCIGNGGNCHEVHRCVLESRTRAMRCAHLAQSIFQSGRQHTSARAQRSRIKQMCYRFSVFAAADRLTEKHTTAPTDRHKQQQRVGVVLIEGRHKCLATEFGSKASDLDLQ